MDDKWFDDEFLPSIFTRAGMEKGLWLTRKQTDICKRYITDGEDKTHYIDSIQQAAKHIGVYYWQNRKITLSVSALNGCGLIWFGMTETEKTEATKQFEKFQESETQHIKERHKAIPKIRQKYIETAKANIERYTQIYNESMEWYEKENDSEDLQDALKAKEQIEFNQKELEFYEN